MKRLFFMTAMAITLLMACNDGGKTNTAPQNEAPTKEVVKPATDTATNKVQTAPTDSTAKAKEAKEEKGEKEEKNKKDKDD